MTFVLATGNEGKLKEMRGILSGFGLDVVSQKEAGFLLEPEETGETFCENARIKAAAAARASGLPAIADDSGLEVAALGGRPGVYSKRYGGFTDDAGRNAFLLKEIENAEHRTARFVCCIVCCFPNGDEIAAEGDCRGFILSAPRGSGGFGYDPVFLVGDTGKSMAELTNEEKNAVSHRGKALRAFVPKLRDYLSRQAGAP
jgi:XTP/dITP diphosphohydrolase